jgi:hypothetical protein
VASAQDHQERDDQEYFSKPDDGDGGAHSAVAAWTAMRVRGVVGEPLAPPSFGSIAKERSKFRPKCSYKTPRPPSRGVTGDTQGD